MNIDQIAYALKGIEAARAERVLLDQQSREAAAVIHRNAQRHGILFRQIATLRAEIEAHLAGDAQPSAPFASSLLRGEKKEAA